ncbi:MAG: ubiquinol-cytochrome c reductase cytochrome c1 subunit [Gammaproteobacteria bacterium]|jgi:ubiquinol-cytochrome c reductase cytochrome c1 subunit
MRAPIFLLVTGILFSSSVFAASGGHALMHANNDLSDRASLQRGARTFVNYCLSCHSAAYMRFNRIGQDLGISDDILKSNLMFGTDKTGDTMTIAMTKLDAESYFGGAAPPDLSVTARSKGVDWLYTYFMTFYRDSSRPFGVNNLAFKDVSMPHVLWELQGWQRPVFDEEQHKDGSVTKKIVHLEQETEGTQSPQEYAVTVRDLVNFMDYIGEPIKLKRHKIGFWAIFYLLLILLPIVYLLKKEYWKDVH